MNSKDTIKLWSHLKKEDYLRILKDKTYEYTLTNTYMANSFLCKVQDDQIYVYYTGKGIVALGGFKGFEAYIKECGEGITLEGRFAIARHVKLLWSPFFIFMWIGILWFIIRAPHMGIIIIPLGAIISSILYMIVKNSDETEKEEAIMDFLVNLHIK